MKKSKLSSFVFIDIFQTYRDQFIPLVLISQLRIVKLYFKMRDLQLGQYFGLLTDVAIASGYLVLTQ